MTRPHASRARLVGWLTIGSLVAVGGVVGGAVVDDRTREQRPTVHAERSGLRLGLQALTGRVTLVASVPVARWRVVGTSHWRTAQGHTLVRNWPTARLPDGPYHLELETRAGSTTHPLFVRNHTYLPPSREANASIGLDTVPADDRAVVAAFARRSYAPGDLAVLHLWNRYPPVEVAVLHIGPEQQLTVGNETLEGVRVAGPFRIRAGSRTARVRIGDWESGVYAARLSSGTKVGFAPLIVRPRLLGRQPVAVVQPTNTWEAYNYRCANGDGVPDTWYYTTRCRTVDVSRPYLKRGVPPHFRQYDVTFLRWLDRTGRDVDMLAQEDLERLSGDELARLYRLIVFPGHHEYVTVAEYDAIQRYRDLGGNLAFLSANNFFWRVDRRGNRITRVGLWRDLGRPEAALVGVQYFDWNHGTYDSRPFVVVGADRLPWLFRGTSIQNGNSFGMFGIEVDDRTPASPPSTQVVAVIPAVFGSPRSAEMTYYETASGARVFAAGAFTLSGTQLRCPWIARFLANLWDELSGTSGRGTTGVYGLGACRLAERPW